MGATSSAVKSYRAASLKSFAGQHDCSYTDHPSLPTAWKSLGLFRKHRRRQRHLIQRIEKDRAVHVLDFGYQMKSGGPRRWQTVVVCDAFARDVPAFRLEPADYDNSDTKALRHSGMFTSHYRLSGRSRTMLERVFDNAMMAFFEYREGWVIEGINEIVAFYQPGQLIGATDLRKFVSEATQMSSTLDRSLRAWDRRHIEEPFEDRDFDTVHMFNRKEVQIR